MVPLPTLGALSVVLVLCTVSISMRTITLSERLQAKLTSLSLPNDPRKKRGGFTCESPSFAGQSGTMVLRWTATGVLEAERGFRKLVGYRAMPILVAALFARDAQCGGNPQVDVAEKAD